ncbi:MAG: hypothetical protein KC503_32210 [Myxococcales bacterium]|nr:hypothetical protein [Myxococcales bacterium]
MNLGSGISKALCGTLAAFLLAACGSDGDGKVGDICSGRDDCVDKLCHRERCVSISPLRNGETCKVDAECRSFSCVAGACTPGQAGANATCLHNEECTSQRCVIASGSDGKCDTPPTPDTGPDTSADAGADSSPDAPPPDSTADSSADAPADSTGDQPAPDTSVDQPAPDTTADGPTPDSTVDGPTPDATVDGPAPDATVDGPAPDTTVDMPPPDTTIDMPPPDTTVDMPPPDSTIDSGTPDSTVDATSSPTAPFYVAGEYKATITLGQGGSQQTLTYSGTAPKSNIYVAQYNASGFQWAARIVSPETLTFGRAMRDATDGSLVVGFVAWGGSSANVTVYNTNGTVGATLTSGGSRGADTVANAWFQVLVRYNADGTVRWVRRFGADRSGFSSVQDIGDISRVGTRLRVAADVNSNNSLNYAIVFGPGETNEATTTISGSVGVVFEVDYNSGDYVASSVRYVYRNLPAYSRLRWRAAGSGVQNSGGAFAAAGSAEASTAPHIFDPASVTLTCSQRCFVFARFDASGQAVWANLGERTGGGLENPFASATATLSNGDAIFTGNLGNSGGTGPKTITLSQTGAGTQGITYQTPNGLLLVRYTAAGTIAWLKRIETSCIGTPTFYDIKVDEANNALYAAGTLCDETGGSTTFGPGETNQLVQQMPVNSFAAAVLRFRLSDGAFQWVRWVGPGVPATYNSLQISGSQLVLGLEVVQNANPTFSHGGPQITAASSTGGIQRAVQVRYDTAGNFVTYSPLFSGAHSVRFTDD